ncbi:hypothetical protein I4U23_016037 [Adineta vaga]|nr:hypothetical protein I4U23_016037 [Adineta vaga]
MTHMFFTLWLFCHIIIPNLSLLEKVKGYEYNQMNYRSIGSSLAQFRTKSKILCIAQCARLSTTCNLVIFDRTTSLQCTLLGEIFTHANLFASVDSSVIDFERIIISPSIATTTTLPPIIINVMNSNSINAFTTYGCSTLVNATATSSAEITNLCSTDRLNIKTMYSSEISLKQSRCPQIVGANVQSSSTVRNLCASDQMSIKATTSSKIYIDSSTVCPQIAVVNVQDSSEVQGLCATNSITISATDFSTISMIRSSSTSQCPLIANVYTSGSSTVYVCATNAINIIATNTASVNYYGPLNSSQLTSGATANPW